MMFKWKLGVSATALIAAMSGAVNATEITVCVVDTNLKDNPVYQGKATSRTKLNCEKYKKNQRPTLDQLYADGWELIQVVAGDTKRTKDGGLVSFPVYYMQRDKGNPRDDKKDSSDSSGFSFFE